MTTTMYRIHLIGMCVRVMRSFLFNLAVFFAGTAVGMGFTVMHVQKVWKEKYAHDTVVKLEHMLNAKNIHDKDIDSLMLELRDKQIENIDSYEHSSTN